MAPRSGASRSAAQASAARGVTPAKSPGGSPSPLNVFVPEIYDRLREVARYAMRSERAGHTLLATALVHEAYVKLAEQASLRCESPLHLKAIAAIAMSQVLVDHARKRTAVKAGGSGPSRRAVAARFVPLTNELEAPSRGSVEQVVLLAEALAELEKHAGDRVANGIRLRLFGGLEQNEIATILGVSRRTVQDDWTMGRGWLRHRLGA